MCDELSLFAKLHKYLHLFSSIIHHFPLALIPTTTATTPPPTTTPNKAKMEARQKVLSIKKSQETAQSLLPPNTLYIALCIRSDPPPSPTTSTGPSTYTPPRTPPAAAAQSTTPRTTPAAARAGGSRNTRPRPASSRPISCVCWCISRTFPRPRLGSWRG